VYGAQLDINYIFTSETEVDLLELDAPVKGKIETGYLDASFAAKLSKNDDSRKTQYCLEIVSGAIGIPLQPRQMPPLNRLLPTLMPSMHNILYL